MSAGTSTTPVPVQTAGPNLYRFRDHQGATQITYYPYAFGPVIVGQPRGPKFEYMGEEGSLTFTANQIQSANSPMGTLLTVTLRPNQGLGALLLTLVLPQVPTPQLGKTFAFKTIAIKTKTRDLVEIDVPDETYTVLRLNGEAESVELPQ
jgi:hypothetical protein